MICHVIFFHFVVLNTTAKSAIEKREKRATGANHCPYNFIEGKEQPLPMKAPSGSLEEMYVH